LKPNTPGFIGDKLKEAREARGLNATALADLLGVSRQSISKYENGLQSPSPEVMDDICRLLRMPIGFFMHSRKRKVDEKSPVFYRSLSSATKTERLRAERRYIWLQDIFSYLWQFIDFPDVNIPSFDLPDDPTQISSEMIEEIAVKTRRFWNLGDGPISNVTWLLENNGIIIGCYSLDTATLDAFSQFAYDRPHIILGTDKNSAVRSRFNAAHELGHLILHRNVSCNLLKKHLKLIEEQAHLFAGAFHFTETAFYDEVTTIDLDYFKLLKRKWKISIGAMIERAKNLGFVEAEESKSLWRSYVRRGWKKNEPLDDEIPGEEPQLLKNAFELIIDNKLQSRSDVIHKLKLDPQDIEEIAGLRPNYLKPAEVIELPIRSRVKEFKHSKPTEKTGEVISLFDLLEN
jgi:Zn-dependent peptidase ImmA (M78 family)/transcriptional regulator with XRE-family HTH domain